MSTQLEKDLQIVADNFAIACGKAIKNLETLITILEKIPPEKLDADFQNHGRVLHAQPEDRFASSD